MDFIWIHAYFGREEDLDCEGCRRFQAFVVNHVERGCVIVLLLIRMDSIELMYRLASVAKVPPHIHDLAVRRHRRSCECDLKRRRAESGLGIYRCYYGPAQFEDRCPEVESAVAYDFALVGRFDINRAEDDVLHCRLSRCPPRRAWIERYAWPQRMY